MKSTLYMYMNKTQAKQTKELIVPTIEQATK